MTRISAAPASSITPKRLAISASAAGWATATRRDAGACGSANVGQREQGLSPYSCFNLVGAAQVGKSSLTGMRVLHRLRGKIAVWPFDPLPPHGAGGGRDLHRARRPCRRHALRAQQDARRRGAGQPAGRPRQRPHTPLARYDDHTTDAILTAAWLRQAAERSRTVAPRSAYRQNCPNRGLDLWRRLTVWAPTHQSHDWNRKFGPA